MDFLIYVIDNITIFNYYNIHTKIKTEIFEI
jgi:hypothetical protein